MTRGNMPEPDVYAVAIEKKGTDWFLVDLRSGVAGRTGDPVQTLRWLENRIGSRYANMALDMSLNADCKFSIGRHDRKIPRCRQVSWWHKLKIWIGINRMEELV